MAEYIEREAVLKIIADNCPHDKCGYNTEEEMGAGAACYYIRKDVDNIPSADVVPKSEVVRCQECKHRTEDGFCHIDIEGVGYKKTHEDGFCDKGET